MIMQTVNVVVATVVAVNFKTKGEKENEKRKVFLDGYIELVPELFRGRASGDASYVSIDSKHCYMGISAGAMHQAKVKVNRGEVVSTRIGIHESKDKFVIVFDEEGTLKTTKKHKAGSIRFANVSVVKSLVASGFTGGKRYKASSPEENVIVVIKEEM